MKIFRKKVSSILLLLLILIGGQADAANADVRKIDQAWDEVYKSIGWLTQYFRDITANGDAAEYGLSREKFRERAKKYLDFYGL